MTDRHAVIWTRASGVALKMGDFVNTDTESRFTYSPEFLENNNIAGLSLLANPSLFGERPVIYRTKDLIPLMPRLMSLIPGQGLNNIQRKIFTRILNALPTPPRLGLDTDWALLLMGGHNGIGHIDVFRDDRVAENWYNEDHIVTSTHVSRTAFWDFFKEDMNHQPIDLDINTVSEIIGPTPTVGGMIPKLLVAIPDNPNWKGDFTQSGTKEIKGQRYIDVVLKIDPMEYRGVTYLESLCLELHRELGFEVPRTWEADIEGQHLLAIERFDRSDSGLPLPLESFFSVIAFGNRRFQETADITMRDLAEYITKLATIVDLNPRKTQRELFKRFCVALCTGNGDMHLENLSFLGGPKNIRLSPVYDPAPMRAWSRHNTRSAIPIEFESDLSFGDNIVELGTAFGYSRKDAVELIFSIREKLLAYPDKVMSLNDVPIERREYLTKIVKKEHNILKKTITVQ